MHTGALDVDVSNEKFAEQVLAERLNVIWKATAVLASAIFWVFLALEGADNIAVPRHVLIPWCIIIAACIGCSTVLQRERTLAATWVYCLGILGVMGYLLYFGEGKTPDLVPFLGLAAVYVMGMMAHPRHLVPLVLLSIGITLAIPWIRAGGIATPAEGGVVAVGLSLATAMLSAQVSGELYGIADWALENYRRERDSAYRLYESRQQVEKSLLRQQALTSELEKMNEDLAIARKTAEEAKHFRGQFLANMSHELRTPLNAVIGFSETMLNFPMMYNNVELPEEYHQDLEQIHNSGKHLLSIINDILDLSKIDAGQLDVEIERVDLEPIFRGVMSTAVGLVGGKPVKLTRDMPDTIPNVMGDPVRIRQVLLNLYSNAAKFTPEGSIKLSVTPQDALVRISLSDTGEGIHAVDIDHIFEEFRQGTAGRKKARAGSGLGLPISRQLLELMGGEIWVESEVGVGSTFYFTLPIYQDGAAEANAQKNSEIFNAVS